MVGENKTSLTSNALWSMLGPLLVALFIWEEPGLPLILQELGLPHEPWIREIWYWSWSVPFPDYVVDFSDVFGLIAIVGGFLKFWLDDQLVAGLDLQDGQKVFTSGDYVSITVITGLSVAAAWIIGYPFEPVPIVQGLLVIVLYAIFTIIVSSTRFVLGLPKSTTRWTPKIAAFGFVLIACTVATTVIVLVMQYLQYFF